ncbi:hypothetical protein [Paraburkholderia phenoliruptrix]|uniref:CHAP domain-containing protein n=2 Tax=Paraburkholderia phenoliruptrix TaxID=252970 RepID=K0DY98_9BURK|nr:hypothetical protein [Paraburkholderia phenoliruptrix]AFT89900.1 hypothetical protein BUPH_00140 [Paraburkholderia phenoliruptrix BR3459a]MDR6417835.1 hypothetical protein [Paraburkholderia phenoliruptrix]CAB4046506.1 hypothetical protein LMG9964_00137 [Paraburkholderia phenoliruptrix]
MTYSAFSTLSYPAGGYTGAADPSSLFTRSIIAQPNAWASSGGNFGNFGGGAGANWNSPGGGDNALEELFLQFLLSITSPSQGSSGMPMPSMPSLPGSGGVTQASYRRSSGAGSTDSGGTVERGDPNVRPAGSGNAAGVAQTQLHKSAASIMADQGVPMDKGVDTTVCCANFASACLVKSGKISETQHTNLVSTLHSELKGDGWRTVSRGEAKPGDICIVGDDEHVEIVASNENGRITLIGSNNTQGGSGPQVVSYDTYTGNRSDVTFLSE